MGSNEALTWSVTVALTENYRSTPEILGFANRLLAAEGRSKALTATRPTGPPPIVERYPDGGMELAALTRAIRGLLGGHEPNRFEPSEIAILVRMNAQLAPIEEALTRAGIAYQVRGVRFYDRPEVKAALATIRALPGEATGRALGIAIRAAFRNELGYEPGDTTGAPDGPRGDEARERAAAVDTVLAIVDEVIRADPAADRSRATAELEQRATHERRLAMMILERQICASLNENPNDFRLLTEHGAPIGGVH